VSNEAKTRLMVKKGHQWCVRKAIERPRVPAGKWAVVVTALKRQRYRRGMGRRGSLGIVALGVALLSLFACGRAPAVSQPSGESNLPVASAPRVTETPELASQSRQASPTLCVVSAVSLTPALVSGGSLPAGASSAPTTAMAVVFSRSVVDPNKHLIQLVGNDGRVVARAQANNRSEITGTCGNDVNLAQVFPSMPLLSTSRGRVYQLDGDTDVRFIAPDGTNGLATKVPGSSHAVAMFAVSPDDSAIAVSVFDYAASLVADRLYVEDLAGGAHHVDLHVPPDTYLWPAGWHAGKLVVGLVTSTPSFGFYAPIPRITSFELLDPSSGDVLSTIGDAKCAPQASLPSAGGAACETQQGAVGVIDWTGSSQIWASADIFTGGACVSTDGTTLAASGSGATLRLISSPTSGSNVVSLGSGYPGDGGWLDSSHLVARIPGTPSQSVFDTAAGRMAPLPADSVLVGRLPGGL
jgi:hypothetical protein